MISIKPQFIQLDNQNAHELRRSAESCREFFHFCTLESLKNILLTKSIKLNNLNNFTGVAAYEKDGIDPSNLGSIFITSFSRKEYSKELWSDFADNKRGARLSFKCSDALHNQLFDKCELIKAYSRDGHLVAEYGFNISHVNPPSMFYSPNFSTKVSVDLKLSDVKYSDDNPDAAIIFKSIPYINLTNISQRVRSIFRTEQETRIIGVLRSATPTNEEDVSYLLAPLDLSKVKISVLFGEKANKSDKEELAAQLKALGINSK